MSINRISLILLIALFVGGCHSFHHHQLFIHNESTISEYAEARAEVREKFLAYANINGLMDITYQSKRQETVGYFKSPGHQFPISLGIREVEGGFVVDLLQYYVGTTESEEYSKIKTHLEQYLISVYGDRATVVPHDEHIGITIKDKM